MFSINLVKSLFPTSACFCLILLTKSIDLKAKWWNGKLIWSAYENELNPFIKWFCIIKPSNDPIFSFTFKRLIICNEIKQIIKCNVIG